MSNEIYKLKGKIEIFGNEDFKGCINCPLMVDINHEEGGEMICSLFGDISSWSSRGGGVDYDIKKEDGTMRLPECELNNKEILEKAIFRLKELSKNRIFQLEKEIKELKKDL